MSNDSKVPPGDDLSHALREKISEANQRQRHLSEAAVHARQVLESLKPVLDDIAAYMHRETGLDIISGHSGPALLSEPLSDSATARVATEQREVTVPFEPPVSLIGGFQVQISIDNTMQILAFWSAGDCKHNKLAHCWTELIVGTFGGPDQSTTTKRAADAIFSHRRRAAEFLLDSLNVT